jgi:glycosyltransferase involved in cell wall biosynthesis
MFFRGSDGGRSARTAGGSAVCPDPAYGFDRDAASHQPVIPRSVPAGPAGVTGRTPPALAPHWPRVSVVIPAKNEARCLPEVLVELPEGLHEVILVDGGSTDGSAAAALSVRPDLRVVRQTRRGKGNALVCGIAACTGDVIVLLDADGSADPAEIAHFVAALVAGADFAKGSRFLGGGGSADLTVLRRLGNAALAAVMNRLYGTSFTDLCYGYNAFWRHCVKDLALPESEGSTAAFGDGFEIETVIAAHVATAGLAVTEVPSFERERFYGTSNLNTWRDGWRVLCAILLERRAGTVDPRSPAMLAGPLEAVHRP